MNVKQSRIRMKPTLMGAILLLVAIPSVLYASKPRVVSWKTREHTDVSRESTDIVEITLDFRCDGNDRMSGTEWHLGKNRYSGHEARVILDEIKRLVAKGRFVHVRLIWEIRSCEHSAADECFLAELWDLANGSTFILLEEILAGSLNTTLCKSRAQPPMRPKHAKTSISVPDFPSPDLSVELDR